MDWTVPATVLAGALAAVLGGLAERWYDWRKTREDRERKSREDQQRRLRQYLEASMLSTDVFMIELASTVKTPDRDFEMQAQVRAQRDKVLARVSDQVLSDLLEDEAEKWMDVGRAHVTAVEENASKAEIQHAIAPAIADVREQHRRIRRRMDELGWPDAN